MNTRKNLVPFILAGLTGLTMFACTLGSVIQPPAAQATRPANLPQSTAAAQAITAAPQPPPSLSADEVYKAIDAAMAKVLSAGPHHVSQASALKGGAPTESAEADIVPPGQLHMVMSSKGSVVSELYVMDGVLYTNSQGAWTKKPGGGQAYIDAINGVKDPSMPEAVRTNGKVVGVELVSGKPAIVYSCDSTIKSFNTTSTFTVWVDQVSGLPVKQEITDSKGSKIDQVYTYDSGITITLPADAKSAKVAP